MAAGAAATESVNDMDFKVPEELRCTYRSKPCGSMRAIKANGEHHKLCDLHRKRANINQQRVHLRRRLSRRQLEQLDQKYGPLPSSVDFEERQIEPSSAPCGDLSPQELLILTLLLSDDPADQEAVLHGVSDDDDNNDGL